MKALIDCGVDVRLCHYDVTSYGERRWMVDDEVIADFGTGFAAKIWKRVYYSPILDYARREGIDFVYMRSFHNASPFTLRLVKSLKRTGAKVVMEIPTYPYDQEYVTRSMKFHRPLFPSQARKGSGRYRHFLQCGRNIWRKHHTHLQRN